MNRKCISLLAALSFAIAGCASTPSRSTVNGYISDPNQIGFSITQAGKEVKATSDNGQIVFNLRSDNFSFQTSRPELRIYLSDKEVGEFRNSRGTQISHLSSALSGASSPDSTMLFVANADNEFSPNNALDADHGLKQVSPNLYRFDVTTMLIMKKRNEISMANFSGDLFGFAWVDFNANGVMDRDEVTRLKLSFAK